jgi:isoleucyl-tRNA synthetase
MADDLVPLLRVINEGKPFELTLDSGEIVELEPADLFKTPKAWDGWAVVEDRSTVVAVDARLTPELRLEGTAREFVRQIQDQRKKAGLQMEDRIQLYLSTDSEALRQAIEAYRDYIENETLVKRWVTDWAGEPLSGGQVHKAQVKVDGHSVTIELRKTG